MKKNCTAMIGLLFSTLLLLTSTVFSSASEENAHATPQYKLRWEENFTGRSLDSSSWSKIDRLFPEWCKYMSPNEQLYDLSKGRMRLYAKVNNGIEPNDTAPYLTGGISTWHKVTFKYGKIEVRARMKGAKGCWPAIWIKNEDQSKWGYPDRAEIDILEYYNTNSHVQFSIHSNYTDVLKKTTYPQHTIAAPIQKNKYNTYVLEILPDEVKYSVNGSVVLTYPKLNTKDEGQYPFGEECYLLIDMQIGNKWLKEIDVSNFPAYMDIDWVKIYDLL